MGCSKKRIDPRILNYVNRNFYSCFTKTVVKAVKQLPSPWEPCRLGRKGHDSREVAVVLILKVGFNQTYDSIEVFLKESETFKNSFNSITGHSVTHRGMKKLSTRYISKVMNRVTTFLKRKAMNIAVDSIGFSTTNSSFWYDIRRYYGKTKEGVC